MVTFQKNFNDNKTSSETLLFMLYALVWCTVQSGISEKQTVFLRQSLSPGILLVCQYP